ncbi:23S rRNA (uracil(1939)-C(5))-methyltransferase RlmD [Pseudoalteromonas sp. CIP111854]|uniref:23S rRNA (Uracil(1939)-C(5))-methyltransferase RlmD n=1 Tax=Pseudoalteromonas holothuriae TaxID=2963714 RepID=A0A9W4R469_9GAMM|nr:23S rRNA (uracil(1939)-C(5))-methyltransferase RlmD [Pseudoalteromonas sp. CIP111854]CAH9066082.1 23S rRNA (uracil(1939)-C(5))-methyltransferase RlmD [Pseudoalteromonas sp. CIP111854]
MAQFFRAKAATSKGKNIELTVESIDHQGRGVAKYQGKVCFVEGALAGECVKAQIQQEKAKLIIAKAVKIVSPSEQRVMAFCKDYHLCGGCQLQHLDHTNQLTHKHKALDALFMKFTKVANLPWQAAIESESTHYRRAARVACIFDNKAQRLKLGFRGAKSKQIVEVAQCNVLTDPFVHCFSQLRETLNRHTACSSISHIQLCDADNGQFVLFRHTKKIEQKVKDELATELKPYNLLWDDGSGHTAYMTLPSYKVAQLNFEFKLDNFVQVNRAVNEKMLLQAQSWLDLSNEDTVLDLFCGIGNFSLLVAKQASEVIGVEGSQSSVAMAKQNAHTNQLNNVQFFCFDLTQSLSQASWFTESLNVLLLDPSRTGAYEILKQLPLIQFEKVLYVSCDPVTLARDCTLLIEAGFKLDKIGLMNMFPHTGHIETMALFQRR